MADPARGASVADAVVDRLRRAGVARLHGLCGGHIQPLWDAAVRQGTTVLDTRHEFAAIVAAHGEAAVTDRVAVATVTAGPGFTNSITGLAHAARADQPLLVLVGRPPTPQLALGAMQDIAAAELSRPLVPFAETAWSARAVPVLLDAALAAAEGRTGPPGPAVLEVPTDVLRAPAAPWEGRSGGSDARPELAPDPATAEAAAEMIRGARRPVMIGGGPVRRCPADVGELLTRTGAVYLDTAASRGALLPLPERSALAVRKRALAEADVVVTLGRALDFQLGYGSPAVFASEARFVRIGRSAGELVTGRRGDIEVVGDVGPAARLLSSLDPVPRHPDEEWLRELPRASGARAAELRQRSAAAPPGDDGRVHPLRLVHALNEWLGEDAAVVVDGGDVLSFARVGLRHTATYLDCGPFGTLGIGVPSANGIAAADPGRQVVALVGDGALGFSATELDTAARHGLGVVVVVANNAAWNIERHDQLASYGGRLVGSELADRRLDELGRALGAHGERVEDARDLPGALRRAHDRAPALVDVAVSRAPLSGDFLSGLAGVPDWQPLTAWDEAEQALQGRIP